MGVAGGDNKDALIEININNCERLHAPAESEVAQAFNGSPI